jgi:hypothetical protein
MALTSKSPTKSSVAEKKIKASRKVESKVVAPAPQEEVLEPVLEPVLKPVLEVQEVQEVQEEIALEVSCILFEAGANGPAPPLEEVSCPPCDDESPVLLKKCVKSKPLVNENGDYLNPLTNRYVKFGSSNFKKLLSAGIIKPVELEPVR